MSEDSIKRIDLRDCPDEYAEKVERAAAHVTTLLFAQNMTPHQMVNSLLMATGNILAQLDCDKHSFSKLCDVLVEIFTANLEEVKRFKEKNGNQ